MATTKPLRKQLFVDPKVQGALVWRAILYWCVCIGTMFLMLLFWQMLTGPARPFYTHFDNMWFYYGPALIVSVIIVPIIVVDIIRVSNRFAGPLMRLRRSMRALARGEHVEPIRFRDGDFWQDFAEEFNVVAARVQGETFEGSDSNPSTTHSADLESVATSETSSDETLTTNENEQDQQLEAAGTHGN